MKRLFVYFMSLLLIVALGGCNNSKNSVINRIKELSNLEFPSDADVIFDIKDNVFMHGRLAQYTVMKFKEYPEDFLIKYDFSITLSQNFKNKFLNDIDKCYSIKKEDIKSEYLPNFENNNLYLYLEEKDISLIYDINKEFLIVFITAQ